MGLFESDKLPLVANVEQVRTSLSLLVYASLLMAF